MCRAAAKWRPVDREMKPTSERRAKAESLLRFRHATLTLIGPHPDIDSVSHGRPRRTPAPFLPSFFFCFSFFYRVSHPESPLSSPASRRFPPTKQRPKREREREKEHRVGPCLMNIHEDRRVSDAATEMWFFFPARRP